jgi:hypothetical protein
MRVDREDRAKKTKAKYAIEDREIGMQSGCHHNIFTFANFCTSLDPRVSGGLSSGSPSIALGGQSLTYGWQRAGPELPLSSPLLTSCP